MRSLTTNFTTYILNLSEKSESLSVLSNSLRPHELFSPWNSPGQNTGVGSLSLLQRVFPTRDQTQVSRIAGGLFTSWDTREAQEHQSGCPILAPGDLPDPGIEPGSPALEVESLPRVMREAQEREAMGFYKHLYCFSKKKEWKERGTKINKENRKYCPITFLELKVRLVNTWGKKK